LKADTKQQESIMQYLLGQAGPEESSSFDERLVTESEFYDEVLMAEDELIDQYLSGELSESERERFENHFLLLPERQSKVRFGRAFNMYVSTSEPLPDEEPLPENVSEATRDVPKPPPKPPWYKIFLPGQNPIFAYSLIAAVALIVAGVTWLALKNRSKQEPGAVYAVVLTSGVTRGAGSEKKINIPPGTGTLDLRPEIRRDDYVEYQAVLLADDGSEVWRADKLQAKSEGRDRFIDVNVPVRLLAPRSYRLKVSGLLANGKFEDLPSYQFTMIR
jgi:hypothetical protein